MVPIIWFTGLSGSGKTTLGKNLASTLSCGLDTKLLDGDELRKGLCSDLAFSAADRNENIRRVRYVAKILSDCKVTPIVTYITPYEKMRQENRKVLGDRYIEVFLSIPFEKCVERDVKGLYKKALNGEIENFTGLDDPFEPPQKPDIVCYTDEETIDASVNKIFKFLESRK